MTFKEIAARLRAIADREPTYVWRELYALAREIEDSAQDSGDMEALVRATQPARRPSLLAQLVRRQR